MRRELLLAGIVFIASCASTRVSQSIVDRAEINMKKFPSLPEKKKEKRQVKRITGFLNGVPVKEAIKAFCLDQNLSCDASQVSENLKISVSSFDLTPEQFLNLLKEKAGVTYSKIGKTYFFRASKPITIRAVNLPLGEFLQILSRELGGYSIVIGRGVDLSATVTVLAENQPLDSILKQAFSNLGYEVSVDTERKVIKINGWISKTIQIPSFFSNAKTANISSSSSVYGGTGSGSNTSVSIRMMFLQRMKSDFENTVRNILMSGSSRKAKVSVNYDLGQMYVEGPAERVKEVERYVESLRKKLSKQVVIDVAVVEQRVDSSKTYGIDWNVFFKGLRNKNITVSQQALGATAGVLNIEIDGSAFDSVIRAIQQTGKARIITNFRLSVPNFDVATISSAVSRQFITQIRREINPQTGREIYTTTTQQVSEGSALFVRPVVREDGKVDIVIAPTVSSILGVDGQQFGDVTLQNPIVAQRNSPLRLIVKPGRTYIVGGIVTENDGVNRSGVPYLSDIPVIGAAFGKTEENNRDSIIYVVLRTHILED